MLDGLVEVAGQRRQTAPAGSARNTRSQPELATVAAASKQRPASDGNASQVRVHLGDGRPALLWRGHRAQLQVGMPGQQPQQLASRVSARARHRDPRAHAPPTLCPPGPFAARAVTVNGNLELLCSPMTYYANNGRVRV